MTEDGELLRRYVEEESQESFTELVQRHIQAVHASALRRCHGHSHLAADATQKVFIALARHAPTLTRHPAISGWLFISTRNAVLDLQRAERRRQKREEEATAMAEHDTAPRPLNDTLLFAALDQLKPAEREAVLLRYFHGQAFRQIGQTLRMSEDAARMRVDRALARLRTCLARRGVTSTASVLATSLAGNSALGVPTGLALQVSQAALAVGPASLLTLAGLASLLASAKVPLGLGTAALLVLGGWSFFAAGQNAGLQAALDGLRAERTVLAELLAAQQAALRQPAAPPPAVVSTPPPDATTALRARLAAMPDKSIPEIELLATGDWERLIRAFPDIPDEAKLLEVFLSLRGTARSRFSRLAVDALQRYAVANEGRLPDRVPDLAAYFDEPLPAGILPRYIMMRTGKYDEVPASAFVIGEIAGVVDDFGDSVVRFGRTPQSAVIANGNGLSVRLHRASHLYAAGHQGEFPTKAEDVSEHFRSGEMAAIQVLIEIETARRNPAPRGSPAQRFRIPPVTP